MRGLTTWKHMKYHLHQMRECGETRIKDRAIALQFQKNLELLEIEHTVEVDEKYLDGKYLVFKIKEG